MKNFLRFFSLTVANQTCNVLSQLVLLPLILRIWGHDVAAQWFVVVALANLTTVFDLGLHNAGHAQLLSSLNGDPTARNEFQQTWALTRAMVVGLTLLFLAYEMAMKPEWFTLICIMTASMAIDTILVARGVWFDTMGQFIRVEGGFLVMVMARLGGSIAALTVFDAGPLTLSLIMITTSILGSIVQCYLLRTPVLRLFAGGFQKLRWRSLSVIPLVVADPAVNWARMSLPVVIFAAIAPSSVVATFVALRALFGLARQIIWQVTRYASVRYIQHIDNSKRYAELIAVRGIQASALIGVAVSSAAIVDNGRMLHLWLGLTAENGHALTISFAVGTVSYGYLVVANIMMRMGNVVGVAKRQYIYLVATCVFAFIARYLTSDVVVYPVLLAGQEILIGSLFVASLGNRVMYASVASFLISAVMLCLLTTIVQMDIGGVFETLSVMDLAESLCVAGVTTIATIVLLIAIDYSGKVLRDARQAVSHTS
jgi:hypothetical protein